MLRAWAPSLIHLLPDVRLQLDPDLAHSHMAMIRGMLQDQHMARLQGFFTVFSLAGEAGLPHIQS